MANILFVGNKNYSSWSLRAWLCLRWAGIPFEERLMRLDQPGYGQQQIQELLRFSPNGRVPCLHAEGLIIWDSLAIAEWVAEERPAGGVWPEKRSVRAAARAVSAEMHSGFTALRQYLPMNMHRRCPSQAWNEETQANIDRIDQIWSGLRKRYQSHGPWLFGSRSIADAFYAPVTTRMRTYGVKLSGLAQAYCDTVLADEHMRDWESACTPNSWDSPGFIVIDGLYRSAAANSAPGE